MSAELQPITADGYEKELIGIGYQFTEGQILPVAVYDADKAVKRLADEFVAECDVTAGDHEDCQHWDDAEEYFQFNVIGAYLGAGMPVFVRQELMDQALSGYSEPWPEKVRP